MSERKTFTEPSYRCTTCDTVHGQDDIQGDMGRCCCCGETTLVSNGVGRTTVELRGRTYGYSGRVAHEHWVTVSHEARGTAYPPPSQVPHHR